MNEHTPQKALGQNFLTNKSVVDKLIESADIPPNGTILEIGPGKGVVTEKLAQQAETVIAVDLDANILELAKQNTVSFPNITFIHNDILTYVYSDIAQPFSVVGAIPYNITSPIIHRFMTNNPKPTSLTLIIQKEVAEKIVAKPPRATYLSTFVASQGTATITKNNISPGSFNPAPKVQSAIIHMTIAPKYPEIDPRVFSDFLHRGFTHPRKMLSAVFDKDTLIRANIDATYRPAQLTLDEWVTLFHNMNQ